MSERLIYCASGCTLRGAHHPECIGDCTGCVLRQATHGTLCAFCYQRLATDVASAPDLVTHLRDIGQPHAQIAPPSDGRNYRDPAEGDILPAAWLAADEIHANLASWALLILEEHPHGAAMHGPDEAGAWHTRYGTTVGVRDSTATTNVVRWLTPHLDWIAGQEWAAVMRQELAELIAVTSARWPTAAMVEPTRRASVPCPRCERLSLTYTPPGYFRQAFVVSCGNPDCARVFSESEWDAFQMLALRTKAGRMAG